MVLRFHPFEETEFGKEFWHMFWVSLILHMAVIIFVAFSRKFLPAPIYYAPPSLTTVDLVTMERPQKPVKKAVPVKEKAIPAKPKTEKKIPVPEIVKKKTPPKEIPETKTEPKKEVKPEPKKVEPPPKEYSDKEIGSKIANLQKEVARKRAAEQQAIAARGKITSRLMVIKNKAYQNTVYSIIESNYQLPEGINAGEELEVIVSGIISKDGRIKNIDFVKESSSAAFNSAVIRSLERSSPLPLPPDGKDESFEMRFRPVGLQQE
jgi:colicin import membrane protein